MQLKNIETEKLNMNFLSVEQARKNQQIKREAGQRMNDNWQSTILLQVYFIYKPDRHRILDIENRLKFGALFCFLWQQLETA